MRSPCTAMKSSPLSPQLEKACAQQRRPNTTKKYIYIHINLLKKNIDSCPRRDGPAAAPGRALSRAGAAEPQRHGPDPAAEALQQEGRRRLRGGGGGGGGGPGPGAPGGAGLQLDLKKKKKYIYIYIYIQNLTHLKRLSPPLV